MSSQEHARSLNGMIKVAVLVVLMTLPCGLSAPTNNRCKTHTASELHQLWLASKSRDAHESLYITPPFTNSIRDLRSTSDTDTTDSHLFGDDQECPTMPATHDVYVQQRSICPWYNVLNKDQRRYPSILTEARCRCDRCIGVDGLNQCEPIYYNVNVLRLTEQCDDAGYYKWQSAWVKISVGCTCAHRPTV